MTPTSSYAPTASPDPRQRSRWRVLAGALALVWCGWWYCRGESQTLWMTAVTVAAVAAALPRSLPSNARWSVWTGLAIVVLCLVANAARVAPSTIPGETGYAVDRVVTVAYALGLTALFFRLNALGVTEIMLAGLVMLLRTLGHSEEASGLSPASENVLVWGFILLSVALDLVRQASGPRRAGRPAVGGREAAWRVVWLGAMLLAAVLLRGPVGEGATAIQRQLMGLTSRGGVRGTSRPGGDLALGARLPANGAGRLRMLLLVQAPNMPGYLRERAFVTYEGGRWLAPHPPPASAASGPETVGGIRTCLLVPPSEATVTDAVWQVEVLRPQQFSRLCLPGAALAVSDEGPLRQADANGTVSSEERIPDRYRVAVGPRQVRAYQRPDGGDDPAYTAVPRALSAAISNWVTACPGLTAAASATTGIASVCQFFATGFVYRADVRLRTVPDPLIDFMRQRAGYCVHFASAAALMLRARGLPTRVIGGYLCGEWSPWDRRWVARERDGHAWVEVWDGAQHRWLLADATPPDSRPGSFAHPSWTRRVADLLVARWKRFWTDFRHASPLGVLADAGAAVAGWLWGATRQPVSSALLALVGGWFWWRRRRRTPALPPDARLRAALTAKMESRARRGLPVHLRRRDSETWESWLRRVEAAPEAGAARASVRPLVEGYQRLRYACPFDAAAAEKWVRDT